MQRDTRTLLRAGLSIFGAGLLCVLLMLTVFGGVTRQGPHTNLGWLMLIISIGCVPTGILTLLLASAKLLGDRRKPPAL
jgi:hypothetical protein